MLLVVLTTLVYFSCRANLYSASIILYKFECCEGDLKFYKVCRVKLYQGLFHKRILFFSEMMLVVYAVVVLYFHVLTTNLQSVAVYKKINPVKKAISSYCCHLCQQERGFDAHLCASLFLNLKILFLAPSLNLHLNFKRLYCVCHFIKIIPHVMC